MKWNDGARHCIARPTNWLRVEAYKFEGEEWQWDATAEGIEERETVVAVGEPAASADLAKAAADQWLIDQAIAMAPDQRGLGGRPHDGPGDCPTYHDGCGCTVEALRDALGRAEGAETIAKNLGTLIRNAIWRIDRGRYDKARERLRAALDSYGLGSAGIEADEAAPLPDADNGADAEERR